MRGACHTHTTVNAPRPLDKLNEKLTKAHEMTQESNQINSAGAASNLKGIEIKVKFEFYLLALVFTVLALAIQTSEFQARWHTDALEILGWFLLLISGISGLLRLEKIPIAYFLSADIKEVQHAIEQLGRFHFNTGNRAEDAAKTHDTKQRQLSDVKKKIALIYRWHKCLFIAGIVSIALARALPAWDGIRDSWRQSMSESNHVQNPPTASPSRPAAASTPPSAPTKPADVSTTPPAKASPPTKQRE